MRRGCGSCGFFMFLECLSGRFSCFIDKVLSFKFGIGCRLFYVLVGVFVFYRDQKLRKEQGLFIIYCLDIINQKMLIQFFWVLVYFLQLFLCSYYIVYIILDFGIFSKYYNQYFWSFLILCDYMLIRCGRFVFLLFVKLRQGVIL